MNSLKNSNVKDLRASIVVIGAGGAGLAAAVAAAELGTKDIIVLESRRTPGGNSVFPEGIFAAESYLQKCLGIDARKDMVFKMAMDFAHWKTNPRLVRALIDKSGDTIRWLEAKGLKFSGVVPHYPNQVPAFFHVASETRPLGTAVVKALTKSCEELGVRILCQTEAKKLLTNAKGSITGVLARTEDKELSISTRSVIIATGGFAGNTHLLKKYIPSYQESRMRRIGLPHKGDGLRMASEIGAATEDTVTLEIAGPAFAGPRSISPLIKRPNAVWVNNKGERFTDESVIFHIHSKSANVTFNQPGKTSYVLFDESIKQSIIEDGLNAFENFAMAGKSWPAGLDKDIQSQVEKGTISVEHSLGKIARWMGVSAKVLQHTIDEYNSFCDRGHDDVFAKDGDYLVPLRTPPYYAIRCDMELVVTHGGIKINQHMEVLNQEETPIPGLYAAGVDTGGTDSDTYNFSLTGHSFGFAVNSGRIAGENAGRYMLDITNPQK